MRAIRDLLNMRVPGAQEGPLTDLVAQEGSTGRGVADRVDRGSAIDQRGTLGAPVEPPDVGRYRRRSAQLEPPSGADGGPGAPTQEPFDEDSKCPPAGQGGPPTSGVGSCGHAEREGSGSPESVGPAPPPSGQGGPESTASGRRRFRRDVRKYASSPANLASRAAATADELPRMTPPKAPAPLAAATADDLPRMKGPVPLSADTRPRMSPDSGARLRPPGRARGRDGPEPATTSPGPSQSPSPWNLGRGAQHQPATTHLRPRTFDDIARIVDNQALGPFAW